jgi:hypothetical protein
MKVTLGPVVGQASGSQGGTTFSHNRYGPYTRNRAIPVISTTPAALNAKARMATASQAWQLLTAAQRLSWNAWAQANPIVDTLGFSQVLAGNAAYNSLNILLSQAGDTAISVPPIGTPPIALTSMTLTADIGVGTTDIAFTATPLAAGVRLVIRAAVLNSPAINYVTDKLRIINISAAGLASSIDYQVAIEAVFGALVVGQTVHVLVNTLDGATGLQSPKFSAREVVVSTV